MVLWYEKGKSSETDSKWRSDQEKPRITAVVFDLMFHYESWILFFLCCFSVVGRFWFALKLVSFSVGSIWNRWRNSYQALALILPKREIHILAMFLSHYKRYRSSSRISKKAHWRNMKSTPVNKFKRDVFIHLFVVLLFYYYSSPTVDVWLQHTHDT